MYKQGRKYFCDYYDDKGRRVRKSFKTKSAAIAAELNGVKAKNEAKPKAS